MVIIHGAMCGADPLWQASVIGVAKQHGERNSHAGKFTLASPTATTPSSAAFRISKCFREYY
jgi:hypothetical protein